jgi:formylmethanofuran dehydrogenase subunit A
MCGADPRTSAALTADFLFKYLDDRRTEALRAYTSWMLVTARIDRWEFKLRARLIPRK